ncbi:unnamed protein product [Nyctereutes procyonoides]|uniref:(raccoon dog) hypothetical protein n=1 Tax=Nyctereutes procyonoides TaxID=34880 RepID=A0A811XZH9_NYCPR|nr:unnamed protein product [Nyctereutes procyonoides]
MGPGRVPWGVIGWCLPPGSDSSGGAWSRPPQRLSCVIPSVGGRGREGRSRLPTEQGAQ